MMNRKCKSEHLESDEAAIGAMFLLTEKWKLKLFRNSPTYLTEQSRPNLRT